MKLGDFTPELLAIGLGTVYGAAITEDYKRNSLNPPPSSIPQTKKYQTIAALAIVGTSVVGQFLHWSPKIVVTFASAGATALAIELGEKVQGDTEALL